MLDKDYSPDFTQDSTYTSENPIFIDPSDIGTSDASPDFVNPTGGTGGTPITDYVPASTGGTFSGLVSYNDAKTLTGDYNFTYKSWVNNAISTAITSGGFTTLFNSLFAIKSIADLGTKSHNLTTSLQGGTTNEYYHLTQSQYTLATRIATGSFTGLLSSTDWSTFNSKLSSINVSTGLNYNSGTNTVSLVLNQIDHDGLLNFVAAEHVPLDDTKLTTSYVWSANKIISYVASQIPASITDYVSKANGGNFESLIGYSLDETISNNTDIPHKKYVDDTIASNISSYDTTLFGGSTGSILEYLGTLNITSIGTRAHNSLTTFQGGTTGEYYHLTQSQHTLATQYASATQGGLLNSTDWNTFNNKLDALTAQESDSYSQFLYYTEGYLYYNPAYLDHNSLLNYAADEHTPLDDSSTTTSNLWSASKITSYISSNTSSSFYIHLDSASTVAGRLTSLVEGTDYPTGWTLAADTNPDDLLITHNLGKGTAVLTVWSITGTNESLLIGNLAYSGLDTLNKNAIRIQALATIEKELSIYITLI